MRPEAIHCFDRASVLLAIYPNGGPGPRVLVEIAEDALRDVFGAQGGAQDLVHACLDHFDAIEKVAKEKFRRRPVSPVELTTSDFVVRRRWAVDAAAGMGGRSSRDECMRYVKRDAAALGNAASS